MAQFDLHNNRGDNIELFPYLLDITHEINALSQLRVVIPLCSDGHHVTHLNPVFDVAGQELYLSTMDIAGVPAAMLGDVVGSLAESRTEIVDALDFLVNGF